ncbi:hypothetical protein STRTUCAR8_00049 [Streptomyces turgidiscabies Car8]|uniref:Uncharacterized protein n=1 Tax=Streptomyces turgidiscabies (strain Car8) TaxID=698760 RepID=L7EYW1_STRT8|nr:hypothetical protein STRTUCAR8_00049 [Streptomyces turgidiscabies Car8]
MAVVSVPSAEEELLRAHYEQQYIDENARIDQERAQRDQLAPAQSSAQELPAQLADLQEDLDRAQGALAEIVARQAERDRADESLQAEQAEQAEAARRQGAEVEVTPQIEQDQGPTISYGPQ